MDEITPENVLRKLKMHPRNEGPAVCLIAGQEITRLRAEVKKLFASLKAIIDWDAVTTMHSPQTSAEFADLMKSARAAIAALAGGATKH